MKKNLAYIAQNCGGTLSEKSNPDRVIEGFYTDSRTPSQEKMFLAIKGVRVDGNSFVPSLLEQGFCALTDDESNLSLDGDVIYASDVRSALQMLAKNYRMTELDRMPFVGVTGSVGKTTTKDMIAHALSSGMKVYKTAGNFNSQIGLPQTVLATDLDAECAVVELGISCKDEMGRISRCAMPDISVITNIGHSHIENLGSREAIRDEKLCIQAYSKKDSVVLLNGDEPLLRDVSLPDRTVYYVSADNQSCDCFALDICETPLGISFVADVFGRRYEVSLSVSGRHYVINALFALACASLLSLDVSAAAKSLSDYQSDGKRQYVYQTDNRTVISDCYNASPESMKAALSVLASAKGRRVAVLGDMLELGPEAEALHRLVGTYATDSADVLVTYGTLAGFIADSAEVKEKYCFDKTQRDELVSFLKGFLTEGDTVLYKASNGMNLGALIV